MTHHLGLQTDKGSIFTASQLHFCRLDRRPSTNARNIRDGYGASAAASQLHFCRPELIEPRRQMLIRAEAKSIDKGIDGQRRALLNVIHISQIFRSPATNMARNIRASTRQGCGRSLGGYWARQSRAAHLDLNRVEGLAVVDTNHGVGHLRHDDHATEVRLDGHRLLELSALLLLQNGERQRIRRDCKKRHSVHELINTAYVPKDRGQHTALRRRLRSARGLRVTPWRLFLRR